MDYLIRFVQVHESFRKPEIEALAVFHNIDIEWIQYDENFPFAIVRLGSFQQARTLLSRSISAKSIHELWGQGTSLTTLHASTKSCSQHLSSLYASSSFRFDFDSFQSSVPSPGKRGIIASFAYLGFNGPVSLTEPNETFTIFTDSENGAPEPRNWYLGRLVGTSRRPVLDTYTLKKRPYINTTSMDAELSLLTANMACVGPRNLIYDPFIGTGGFALACAEFGALSWGSDIDGRVVRGEGGDGRAGAKQGKEKEKMDITTNFDFYGLRSHWLGGFVSDLTNTPLRPCRFLDAVVCDPPYGIREGLKVLGSKDEKLKEVVWLNGEAAHLQPHYIPPKRAYSLSALLSDLLHFSATTLVDNGRLCFWMPTANDEDGKLEIPQHEAMELVSCCTQRFNKWSRMLLTYRRIPGVDVKAREQREECLGTASELNAFRKRYFEGFKSKEGDDTKAR